MEFSILMEKLGRGQRLNDAGLFENQGRILIRKLGVF